MKKDRGKFLTILSVLAILGWLISLPQLVNMNQTFAQLGINLPNWYMPYTLVAGLLQVFALIYIWQWKKLGVYLLFGIAAVAILVQVLGLNPLANNPKIGTGFSQFAYIATLIGTLLWFWAIYRKWPNFK